MIEKLIGTFNPDQKEMFDILNQNSKYQFRVPTGVRWFYQRTDEIVYISSDRVKNGERVRIDRVKNGKIIEGGYVCIDELYEIDN